MRARATDSISILIQIYADISYFLHTHKGISISPPRSIVSGGKLPIARENEMGDSAFNEQTLSLRPPSFSAILIFKRPWQIDPVVYIAAQASDFKRHS